MKKFVSERLGMDKRYRMATKLEYETTPIKEKLKKCMNGTKITNGSKNH
jgi:dTDP-D-glucose 4,6-dehydratase